ncbi:MAG: hypothetical protein IT320_05840 [Anaerolineae bacterium]|nr:hypothetical protein [Anaerolineae bacterium]
MAIWTNIFEDILGRYGSDFEQFTSSDRDLVEVGNQILGISSENILVQRPEATGFNIYLPEHIEIPFGNSPFVSYTNYIAHTNHFSILLSDMENRNLIDSNNVALVPRASRFFWEREMEDRTGVRYEPVVESQVELSVFFILEARKDKPQNQASRIANYLRKYADKMSPECIDTEHAWEVPDFRAAPIPSIRQELCPLGNDRSDFETVIVNFKENRRAARILALRQRTKLDDWQHTESIIHYRLARFIASRHVGP